MNNEKDAVARARALLAIKELLAGAEYKERLILISRATFDKYVALRSAGFEEHQALYLVAQSPF